MTTEVANTSQTLVKTVEGVKMAKRNLEKFSSWENVSGFSGLVDKMGQAGNIGNSLGVASGGCAKGLSAFTGDEYDTLSALQDNLKSVGGILDEQSNAMDKQNRGFDQMMKGLNSSDIDGTMAVLQGNANLMAGVAQQNGRIGQHLQNLQQIELAKAQAEINQKKNEANANRKISQMMKDGFNEVDPVDKHDITVTPKFQYI